MRPLLAALLGHWRRHPLELATLLVGLTVATALWSGVQALNAEARLSYARAARLLGGDATAQVVPQAAPRIALADYVALRRAGWKVSPVLEGDLRRGNDSLRLVGIDILTLPPGTLAPDTGEAAAFLLPPYRALAAPETALRLADAADLPPRLASDALPPDTIVLDIAEAARLLAVPAEVSRLLLPPEDATRPLPVDLARRLAIRPPEPRSDLDRLTASFHLNLTAFGALSFLVGLFIVYAAIGLAFEQRRATFRTLRAVGVSARALAAALAIETLALALLGGLAGTAAGYALAAALLPDVAASLRGLYGARVPGSLSLAPAWWATGLAISLAGAFAAAATSLWRAATLPVLARPMAALAARRRSLRRELALAALLALAGAAALAFGRSLAAGFAVMAALLLAAALALPSILAALLALGARAARRPAADPVAAWAWADARQELGGLSLALMALLIALAVNVGVGTMVESFRATFTAYLDQRLAAEAYVTARDDAEAEAIAAWLRARPEVTAVLPTSTATARLGAPSWPLELTGFRDHATYRNTWPLLAALPGAWEMTARGEAALVSEQTARRFHLAPGDRLTLPTPAGPWPVTVAAVYADYGNAEAQVMLAGDALAGRFPELDRRRLAVRADPAATPRLLADLRAAFPLAQATDQRGLKQASLAVFEETFAVTVALNALTFTVAGIALLASLLTLADARLPRLAPVWAIGVTRRRLALVELAKATGLAALTALFALPLGLALAFVLTAVVNVRAFGWRLPVLLFPGQWAALFALALLTAALAALWPALRLRRTSPLKLLQGFSNER